jgi:peptide chain release factor 3
MLIKGTVSEAQGTQRMSDQEQITREVARRRTFAIISHPDAGKTTLTEKLLLYGGAIHMAGSIRAKKAARHATSDWMELERQRGISITTSVMPFVYGDFQINLLDTPGHEDFSEDTYRTLSAADAAVMLIDSAKGVEAQTKKLFEVCRLRDLPIFTFINKMDREGRDPFDLLAEVEQILGIRTVPMQWPIGQGRNFKGVYDRGTKEVLLFGGSDHGQRQAETVSIDLQSQEFAELVGENQANKLRDDIELLEAAGDPFEHDKFLKGQVTPAFFGSAMNNFGVEPFLKTFLALAPPPPPRMTDKGSHPANATNFAGFVFKIQANMDPGHRDRIAFMRICSGRFVKGMAVKHVRLKKEIKLARPLQLFARERVAIEEAFSGDIIGLFDTGLLRIGDTLYNGEAIEFEGVPRFSPEHFARVLPKDAMKRKQLRKGLSELAEEGAVQVYYRAGLVDKDAILGAVGALQLEVVQYRLMNEYSVDVKIERMPYSTARWLEDVSFDVIDFERKNSGVLGVTDEIERPILLFSNEWTLQYIKRNYPNVGLANIAPTPKE